MKRMYAGYFLMLLSFTVMTLHDAVPHHHHHPETSSHQHSAPGHERDHSGAVPFGHAEHADYTLTVTSRISAPEIIMTAPDLIFYTIVCDFSFSSHEIILPGKSPPEPLITTLFHHTFFGLRAPPVSLFA